MLKRCENKLLRKEIACVASVSWAFLHYGRVSAFLAAVKAGQTWSESNCQKNWEERAGDHQLKRIFFDLFS